MKQEVVPTSPKVLQKNPRHRPSSFTVILLSILFGALAGAGVFFILEKRLINTEETLVIREKTGDSQEILLDNLLEKVKPEILEVDSGFGVSLTADGWLVSEISGASVIKKNKEIYEIKEKEFDPATGLSYYKINAQNLKAAEFIDPANKKLGLNVIAIKPGLEIKLLYFAAKEKLNDTSFGSLLFDWQGELVGLTKVTGELVWAEDISSFLSQLLTVNK